MPYITAAQRYNIRPVSTGSESANGSLEKIRRSSTPKEMNRPCWNALVSGGTSYNNLNTRPATYQNGFRGNLASSGAGWGASPTGYGGYEQAGSQDAFYGTPSQAQFYGGTGYGRVSSGRQPPWSQPPAAHYYTVSYSPANYSAGYHAAVHTATPEKGQIVEQQSYTQGSQQYAPNFFPYQPYQQSAPYGYAATPPWLTQQWQPVKDGPPPPPPPPSNPAYPQSFDASAPSFTPRRPFKSVVERDLNKRFRVNKKYRNGHTMFNRSSYQPAVFDENVPPPPSDDSCYAPAPWRQSVDTGRATITAQKQDRKVSTPANSVRTQQTWRNMQSQLGPLAPRLDLQSAPAGPDTHLHVMERPEPTAEYLQQANQDPTTMDTGRPLLVVLDMNGTLVHRTDKRRSLNFIARPRVNEFFHYLFSNHHVMIWSSSKPRTVEYYCKELLLKDQDERLVACWARDKLRIPEHAYNKKVQVYKQLSRIWKDKKIQSANINPVDVWSQENTVLIDDSFSKAASEPYNIITLEEFEGRKEQMETDVLGQVVKYLETLRLQRDVSAYVRWKPFAFDPKKSFDWMPIINDMH